jgi:hypothetical protein
MIFTVYHEYIDQYFSERFKRLLLDVRNCGHPVFIASDNFSAEQIEQRIGLNLRDETIHIYSGMTPAEIRVRGITAARRMAEVIYFCDSDDYFSLERFEALPEGVNVVVNNLSPYRGNEPNSMISEGKIFRTPPQDYFSGFKFLKYNFFGMSNTAVKTDLLWTDLSRLINCPVFDWGIWTLIIEEHFDSLSLKFVDLPLTKYGIHGLNSLGLPGSKSERDLKRKFHEWRVGHQIFPDRVGDDYQSISSPPFGFWFE